MGEHDMEDWKRRRKKLKSFYKSAKWQTARKNALMRDKYLCVLCAKEGKITPADVVHHIEHLTEENVDKPEIALNHENLISLCADHHSMVHKGEHAKGRIFQEEHPYNYTFDANGMLIPKA